MDQNEDNQKIVDLSGILKKSDAELSMESQKSDQTYYAGTPKIIQQVIKLSGGRIDEQQATYIVWGFAALAILVSLFLFFGNPLSLFSKPALVSPSQMEGGPIL